MTHTENILKMAEEDDGASCGKMAARHGTKQNTFSKIVAHQIKKGRLFKSNRPSARTRWFDTQARADDWAAMEPCVPSEWSEAGFRAWTDNPHRVRRDAKPAPTQPIKKASRPIILGKKPGPAALTTYHAEKHTAGPSKLKALQADAPVDASGAKFTKCPSGLDHRFTPAPEEVQPVFSGLGIGRYLEVRA